MNQLVYVLIGIVIVCAAAMVICSAADDTITVQPEPEADTLPADQQCQVADCPREWQTDRSGWRLCHTHYRELVTHRSAS